MTFELTDNLVMQLNPFGHSRKRRRSLFRIWKKKKCQREVRWEGKTFTHSQTGRR